LDQKDELNQNVKERLLMAAGKIFAQKGFKKTSVREICQAADVNVASINYYFSSKENLYFEVVKHWHDVAFNKFPLDYSKNESNPPEERLRSFIHTQLLHTLYDVESPWFGALMSRESIEPTRAIEELTKNSLGPSIDVLFSIVKKLMGQDTPDDTVHLYCASILGQCTFHHYAPKIIKQYFISDKYTLEDIDIIGKHIYTFSMSAIQNYISDSV
jgi:AcrR family transcriptional regulator